MKKLRNLLLTLSAAAVALIALPPQEAQACSWCGSATRCEPANYSGCATRSLRTGVNACESWYANCAWVYDVTNVAPSGALVLDDNSPAPAGTEVKTLDGRTLETGCGGVVVARSYSPDADRSVRAATARLVI